MKQSRAVGQTSRIIGEIQTRMTAPMVAMMTPPIKPLGPGMPSTPKIHPRTHYFRT